MRSDSSALSEDDETLSEDPELITLLEFLRPFIQQIIHSSWRIKELKEETNHIAARNLCVEDYGRRC